MPLQWVIVFWAWAGAVALLAAAPPLRLHPPELRDWNTHFRQACAIMQG